MDMNLRSLTAVYVTLLGVSVFGVGYYTHSQSSKKLADLEAQLRKVNATPQPSATNVTTAVRPTTRPRSDHGSAQQIAALRELIKKKDSLLKEQNELISAQGDRAKELRERLDEAFNILGDTLGTETDAEKRQNTINELRTRLSKAEDSDEERSTELETTQQNLESRENELNELRESLESELLKTQSDHALDRELTLMALKEVGDPAIEAVAGLLTDETPSIRLWAARTLGQLGTAAQPALEELDRATKDGDPDVRAAAVQAIEDIMP